jgi:beta-lactamase regulating signal transducer with metallopeptidase domain
MIGLAADLSYWFASFGPAIVVKATFVLLFTLLVVRLARHSRASLRHLLLTAGFAVVLALPVATTVARVGGMEILPVPLAVEAYLSAAVVADGVASPAAPASGAAAAPASVTTAGLLAAAWATGVLLFTLPVLVGVVQVRRLRRSGRPWPSGQKTIDALAREAGLRSPVDVVLHDGIAAPATCGVRRHMILFPADASTWPAEDVRRAAMHELEHIHRGDCVINVFVRLICAVYWFHPLVWIAWRRLGLEAERASDDAVLRRADATVYADQLVTLAGRLATNPQPPLLAMASRGDLVQRVSAVLNHRQARGPVGTAFTTAIRLAALTLVLAIAPIQISGQALSEERLVGLWDMQPTASGDAVVLRLCYAELFSRTELPVEQVDWWPAAPADVAEQVRFALRRDAGTFTFEGIVARDTAQGRFAFRPSARFGAELQRRGYQSLTPSQHLALAQHDIDLAALDERTRQGDPDADPSRMIGAAQIRAQLEDRVTKVTSGRALSPGVC